MAAKLPVKLLQILGASLLAPSNVATFGSTAAGAPTYSIDPDVIQTVRWVQSWAAAILQGGSPVMQDRVAVDYVITYMLAYSQQMGLWEWMATREYFIGSWVLGPSGMPYISKTDNNLNHALADTNNWTDLVSFLKNAPTPIVNTKQLIKKWCVFNGQGVPGFFDQFGFDPTIARIGVGNYMLTFSPVMNFANFAWTASVAQENAVAATVMATRFPGDTKTISQFQIRTVSNFDSSGFDLPEVSLQLTDAS